MDSIYMRGDALVVWELYRLARSLNQLIERVESLEQRKIGFLSLTEAIIPPLQVAS
jgi:DNA invertase Pin-like site-specific DNA recombinase